MYNSKGEKFGKSEERKLKIYIVHIRCIVLIRYGIGNNRL